MPLCARIEGPTGVTINLLVYGLYFRCSQARVNWATLEVKGYT
jgi:hypothetical protein